MVGHIEVSLGNFSLGGLHFHSDSSRSVKSTPTSAPAHKSHDPMALSVHFATSHETKAWFPPGHDGTPLIVEGEYWFLVETSVNEYKTVFPTDGVHSDGYLRILLHIDKDDPPADRKPLLVKPGKGCLRTEYFQSDYKFCCRQTAIHESGERTTVLHDFSSYMRNHILAGQRPRIKSA